ncbi:MAG: hypothetical protein COT43_05315 [Candidatus Marinimicrobia bacterium CG08_land_8_20_14_0_20_45_22]|nr:MAG: hypothetical protein COT43_05315 [Candidatus Marinimicrobia bacterium CG08_land_8_20_14_0_20_45_22]
MKRLRFPLFFMIFLSLTFFTSAKSQMIAEISTDIETEFGTYHPYPVNVKPAVETYSVAADFSNVSNFQSLSSIFSQQDLPLLQNNAFTVKPTQYKEIFDIYKNCKQNEVPIFVTTDAMLHTFHIIYDYALRILEVQKFAPDLENLNQVLLDEMEALYYTTSNNNLKKLVMKNVAYFGVATKLKDTTAIIPAFVTELVNEELELICDHEGFELSPIFNSESVKYKEDYSQYVPRGHYTRNDTLATYFKAMMWYGRMMFRVEPDTTAEGKQKGKEETLQAILIVKAMNELTVNGESALEVWERIYDPTIFFVGKSDDLDIYKYTNLIKEVYGNNYLSLTVADFANDEKLTEFVEKAKYLRNPLINSSWVYDDEDAEKVTKAFRFMGQRFIPDSYMFQQLVYDKVLFYQGSGEPFTLVISDNGPIRGFPRGLDVMSMLGSQAAAEIIQAEGDADYYKYDQQLNNLKEEFANLEDAVWAQNLYWNWLYSLMPLLEPKGEGYPPFMQNLSWTLKQLYAALSSWAELRHDMILYAKQSYTEYTTGDHPSPDFTYGYVEPNPHLFARLASLANLMRTGLDGRGLLLSEFDSKLINFESLLLSLKKIAEKELTNQELLPEEYDVIWTIGERIENLLTFSKELLGTSTDETDEGMAVIADVHTEPNSAQVLEEGVGYPFEIYVIVKVGDDLVLTRGGGFSYYEFKHPMADRLTDEAWQEMLKSSTPPEIPQWTESFIDRTQSFSLTGLQHAYLESETVSDVDVQINPANPIAGDTLQIKVRAYYCPDSTLTAIFSSEEGNSIDTCDLKLIPDDSTCENYIGQISSSKWPDGTIIVKIKHGVYTLSTYWFELQKNAGINEDKLYPTKFAVSQNYPNPFNPETTIRFDLPENSYVRLEIYNLLGHRVATLIDCRQTAGHYTLNWNGKDLQSNNVASGIYFYKLTAGDLVHVKKMVLTR